MAGLDVDYEQIDHYTQSPITFEMQEERKPFSKYGVFGAKVLNENRFIQNDKDLTTVCTKYLAYNSPSFGKWADHSLDEFIKNESSNANENVNSIMYDANHRLVQKNGQVGVANFKRYTARKEAKVVGM